MSRLTKWFKNRWECIDYDVDMPLLDYFVCYAILPIFGIGVLALIVTIPIWGIPYVVYRVYFAERREE